MRTLSVKRTAHRPAVLATACRIAFVFLAVSGLMFATVAAFVL